MMRITIDKKILDQICEDLQIKKVRVTLSHEKTGHLLGHYIHLTNHVIVYLPAHHNNRHAMVETLLHELRHAHQHQCWPARRFKTSSVVAKFCIQKKRFRHFYPMTLIEVDANKWAAQNSYKYQNILRHV